jgi:hypothetical protein
MATKTDGEHEFLLHEVSLLPDEFELKYLVQMGHALRRGRNWAIIQYNESRIEEGGNGNGNEVEQVTTLFTKARRKPKKKKRKRKRKKKKKTQNAQQLLLSRQRRPQRRRDTSLCFNLSWTSWISLSAFHHEFWQLAGEYFVGAVPAMRGWHHPKQFMLPAEDVRLSECGHFLGIVTEEWDYIYDAWDEDDNEEDERWTIWIEMDRPSWIR